MGSLKDTIQPGILAPVPRLARHVFFRLKPDASPASVVPKLKGLADGDTTVVGFGLSLVHALGANVEGLHELAARTQKPTIPSTPFAIWCWLRTDDRGVHVHQTRTLERALHPAFGKALVIDAFQYQDSLDLSGYKDGIENPQGDEAIAAAFVHGQGRGRDGSSFVAVQQWRHDLDRLEAMSEAEQNDTIGRRKSDNEELDDAPESAHVHRTAQESFDPEAFVLRRSMPWASADEEGLVFIAFGKSFGAFEALLHRMVGDEDGTVDALFRFATPLTGSFLWCPPLLDGELDLTEIGL